MFLYSCFHIWCEPCSRPPLQVVQIHGSHTNQTNCVDIEDKCTQIWPQVPNMKDCIPLPYHYPRYKELNFFCLVIIYCTNAGSGVICWSQKPAANMSKCPWARHWTSSSSQWAGQHLSWQLHHHLCVSVRVCEWMKERQTLSSFTKCSLFTVIFRQDYHNSKTCRTWFKYGPKLTTPKLWEY